MLHPVIPACWTFEKLSASPDRALCFCWWSSPGLKAAGLQLFELFFPVSILLLLFLDMQRSVHAAEMLGKKVLAVELVSTTLRSAIGAG